MLSVPHLIIIFLVALVVLGPEKLPEVARVLGKTMADFRRITTDFRVQIEDEMREIERQTRMREAATAQAAASAAPQLPPAEASAPLGQPVPVGPPDTLTDKPPDNPAEGESHSA